MEPYASLINWSAQKIYGGADKFDSYHEYFLLLVLFISLNGVNMLVSEPYEQGKSAYNTGISSNHNPYPSSKSISQNKDRCEWYGGWYDARIQDKLGHIFEKYGITW